MMIYGIGIPLDVTGPPDVDLFGSVERLADALADLEDCVPELKDSTLSADKTTNTVRVEVSIAADSIGDALNQALACIRTAIHTIGDGTPGWENLMTPAEGEYTSREIVPA